MYTLSSVILGLWHDRSTTYWRKQAKAYGCQRHGHIIWNVTYIDAGYPGQPDVRLFEGEPGAVTTLTDLLGDPDMDIRWAACRGLYRVGRPAAPATSALIQVLLENEIALDSLPSNALGAIGSAAVEPLLAALAAHPDKKDAIFAALEKTRRSGRLEPDVVPGLVNALENADDTLRLIATRLLSHTDVGPQILVPAFTKLLDDRDESVRQAATEGLGNFGTRCLQAARADRARAQANPPGRE
jgi:HEAT repeat protein